MDGIHITDIEAAINHWRSRKPSDGVSACAEVRALADVYALMVYFGHSDVDPDAMTAEAAQAWLAWYATTPDAPCIAICSTSQGDALCKGCGRTHSEVQHWPAMSPAQKRQVWRRITLEATAWRFNRYAERAQPTWAPAPPGGSSGRGEAHAAPDPESTLRYNAPVSFGGAAG